MSHDEPLLRDSNSYGTTPIMATAQAGNLEIFNYLEDRLGPDNVPYDQILHHAARGGNVKILKKVFDKIGYDKVDIESNGYPRETPLDIAISKSHEEVCRFLIDNGADINNSALRIAASGNAEAYGRSFSLGANPYYCDQYKNNALMYAVKSGNPEIVTGICDIIPDKINDANLADKTPFLAASEAGNVDIIRLLLAKGANSTITANYRDALMLAAASESASVETIKELMKPEYGICSQFSKNEALFIASAALAGNVANAAEKIDYLIANIFKFI